MNKLEWTTRFGVATLGLSMLYIGSMVFQSKSPKLTSLRPYVCLGGLIMIGGMFLVSYLVRKLKGRYLIIISCMNFIAPLILYNLIRYVIGENSLISTIVSIISMSTLQLSIAFVVGYLVVKKEFFVHTLKIVKDYVYISKILMLFLVPVLVGVVLTLISGVYQLGWSTVHARVIEIGFPYAWLLGFESGYYVQQPWRDRIIWWGFILDTMIYSTVILIPSMLIFCWKKKHEKNYKLLAKGAIAAVAWISVTIIVGYIISMIRPWDVELCEILIFILILYAIPFVLTLALFFNGIEQDKITTKKKEGSLGEYS